MVLKQFIRYAAVLLLLVFVSCTTPPPAEKPAGQDGAAVIIPVNDVPRAMPRYYGFGTGTSDRDAVGAATRDAVYRAVLDALGDDAFVMQYLVGRIIRDMDVTTYITPGTLEVVERDYIAGSFQRIVAVRININSISDYLMKRGITGGLLNEQTYIKMNDMKLPFYRSSDPLESILGPVAEEWIMGWKPEFLVIYDEEQETDAFSSRAAVLAADTVLGSLGFGYVSEDQLEMLKQDQEYVFIEEKGYSSLIRWAAARLYADYYIDTAVQVDAYRENGSWLAEVQISLECYSASTGEGRGAVFYTNPEPVSAGSKNAAAGEALDEAMQAAMIQLIRTTARYFSEDIATGTRYELTLIGTPSDDVMKQFLAVLQAVVPSARRVSYSREETRFVLQYRDSPQNLEAAIYEAASRIQGLENVSLVMQRGNTLTFSTGR